MNLPIPQDDSPPSPNETGGAITPTKGIVTVRDVAIVVIAVGIALSAVVYLDNRLDKIQSAVHDNARGLAVVQAEITALRRDIERVENQASHADEDAKTSPVSASRAVRWNSDLPI